MAISHRRRLRRWDYPPVLHHFLEICNIFLYYALTKIPKGCVLIGCNHVRLRYLNQPTWWVVERLGRRTRSSTGRCWRVGRRVCSSSWLNEASATSAATFARTITFLTCEECLLVIAKTVYVEIIAKDA